MPGLPVIGWGLAALWSLVLLYVIVDLRRVMAMNSAANERLFGWARKPVTDRAVLLNRIALAVLLVAGVWAIPRIVASVAATAGNPIG